MTRINVAFATILCVLTSYIERTICYNFEPRLPVIKEGPTDSYFGFSVAEHILVNEVPVQPFSDSVLIVGAPIYQTNISAVKPGGVFTCPFTSSVSDCSIKVLDLEGNTDNDIKDNQWLGVSVASQGPGGPVIACAHRTIHKPSGVNEYRGEGKCYLMDGNLEVDQFTRETGYSPCKSQTRPSNYDGYLYKYCQAGTDVDITRLWHLESGDGPNSVSQYIMGIPGTDNWLGGIALINSLDDYPLSLITPLDAKNNGVGFNSYLGFSVAAAKLMDGNARTYIAGAPRAQSMGAVLTLKSEADQAPVPIHKIVAEKPSSSFGYDVAAADLNGDGYDDLIVGAPQYYYYDPNPAKRKGGRVYIYMNEAKDGTFGNASIKLTGPADSLFGHVVASLGDINRDLNEDIAVGAPYENDGMGAVYIYLGDKITGIRVPEAQKITPSDLPMGLNGYPFPNASFGYSIGGRMDLDGNGFPEVVIGAFEVDQIVVLRGRPIINIEQYMSLSTYEITPNTTNCEYSGEPSFCFQVELCMSYFCAAEEFQDPITINFDIEAEGVRRDMVLSSRVLFEDSHSHSLMKQSMEVTREITCSDNYNVILKNNPTDIFRPIPINITYSIPETEAIMPQPGDPLPSMTPFPILQEGTQTILIQEIVFKKKCAEDDNRCITDLDVRASINIEGTPPVLNVGVQHEVMMDVNIANRNEDAYDAKLVITYPTYLEITDVRASEAFSAGCYYDFGENETQYICELGNPYLERSEDDFSIKFNARQVPPDSREFNITLEATSTNDEDSNTENNVQVFTIEVESITDILISGVGQEQVYFSGQVIGESAMKYFEDIGLPINQRWTIFNQGPGAVHTATVTINFPYEVSNGKWLLYMTEMPFVEENKGSCNVTPALYVNELGLKPRNGEVPYSPVDTIVPGDRESAPSTSVAPDTVTSSRKRRQAEASAEGYTSVRELTAGKEITLDCKAGTAKCLTIRCDLDPLTEKDEIFIVIRSRLWNSTFLEDYINAKQVNVITEGFVEIESAPYITQTQTENDQARLRLKVTPDIKTLPPSKPLSWWIILLAVIGGLLILIALILILWRCGFFERKTGYKYATVTQQQASGKAKTEKTAYYDDMYY